MRRATSHTASIAPTISCFPTTTSSSRLDTPKRRAGERKGAHAGGVLQKVSTILIHSYSLLLVRILVQKKTMPAGVNRPSLLICAETPDFPEMTGCRASAWAFGTLLDIRAMNTRWLASFAYAPCVQKFWQNVRTGG